MDDKNDHANTTIKKCDYVCETCHYITAYYSNYKRHIKSYKHEKSVMMTKRSKTIKTINPEQYNCECGKSYKYRQGLYTHRKKCNYKDIYDENEKLKLELKHQHEICELKNKILELTKDKELMKATLQSINLNNNINNINNTNSFNTITKNNIKIFLSEKCADAISIQDFVKQLTISLDDILSAKDNTAKGITSIIERNLKPFSVTTRPVHSIEKDEWYMKDNLEWKEDDGHTLVDKAHRKIQRECLKAYADEADELETEEQVGIVVFGTGELNQASASSIKEQLAEVCNLVSYK